MDSSLTVGWEECVWLHMHGLAGVKRGAVWDGTSALWETGTLALGQFGHLGWVKATCTH